MDAQIDVSPVTAEGTQAPEATPQAQPSAFFTALPDDMKARLSRFEKADAATVGKSYIELETKLSQRPSGVKPLGADATPEEVAAYRQAFGIPEKPDGYELGELPFPEGATPSSEKLGEFRGIAHELHLTPQQVQGVLKWYANDVSAQWNAIDLERTTRNKEVLQGLSKKYGAEAPQLAIMAQQYVKRRWGDEGLDALDFGQGGMGSNAIMIDMLIESARLTGHDQFIAADGKGGLLDPTAAKQQYDAIAAQYYRTQDEAERARLRPEMERLAALAHSS